MALAITSFPVPVSPWIKTAESTGATLSTSAINARNFGLDPIKSKLVIALLLYKCGLCSAFFSDRNQLALCLSTCRQEVHPKYFSMVGADSKADNYRFIYASSNQIDELFRQDTRIEKEKAGFPRWG